MFDNNQSDWHQPHSIAYACTGGGNLNIRNSPNGQIMFTVPDGTRLYITGPSTQGFYPVEVDNWEGFASTEYICPQDSSHGGNRPNRPSGPCQNRPPVRPPVQPIPPIAPIPPTQPVQPIAPIPPIMPPIGTIPPVMPPIGIVPPPIGIMPEVPFLPDNCTATMLQLARVATRGGNLHLRAQPSMNAQIIDRMPNGSKILLLREQGDWYYIYWNHKFGWANKNYILFD